MKTEAPRAPRRVPSFIRQGEPLAKHTTFRIGGPAEYYAEPKNRTQLIKALDWARRTGRPGLVIGWGSNLLIQDGGIRGLVLCLKKSFLSVRFKGSLVLAGAGVHLPKLVKACWQRGLGGLEPLVGVPGTVGGALMSNAGTPSGEIGPFVEEVELVTPEGRVRRIPRPDLSFAYRSSNLSGLGVVTSATLRLLPQDKNVIMRKIRAELDWRTRTQPVGTHNVGSIFRNPPGDHAGRLIEASGLKGAREGGAQFSPKHGNFIVNIGRASSADVLSLIERARGTVRERFGVELELEIKVLGEPG